MIYPMFAMVLLTFIIGCITVTTRFASVKNGTVNAKYFKLMDDREIPEFVQQTTRNFNNQFETPVLFYVVCTLYVCLNIDSALATALAWGFVLFRCIHSYIHLSYNHVIHRLSAFWLAVTCVMAMWVNLLILQA